MCCPAAPRAKILSFLGAGTLGFLLFARVAPGSDFVTVRVWADPDYVAQRAAAKGGKEETYVVAQGEYFEGATRDGSIGQNCLPEILHFLAPTLVKQRYFPAKDPKAADLLIVVHWGTTIPYISDNAQTGTTTPASASVFHDFNAGPAATDPVGAYLQGNQSDMALSAQTLNQTAQSVASATVAGLLGYTLQLEHERQKIAVSEVERTLTSNLMEDRYFVILHAYDFPSLIKDHRRKLLWTAHMSMRSPGMNFTLALPRMGQVASDLYGQNNDEIVTTKYLDGRRSSVEIGPITVLGEEGSKK
jgi:hypothetical protein